MRFRNCCKGRLPGTKNNKKWREAAKQHRWADMMRHLRADVTQYTIWHLSHTVPSIVRQPELRDGWLMNTDIEALSELVENLMWGHARTKALPRLRDALDRLKSNIDDPRWLAKIAYHRAMCALWQDDRERAIVELAPLLPVTPESDNVDLMQIYVDLHGAGMGLTERLAFQDRIRQLSKALSDRLQYGGARAFEILLAGDDSGARKAFDEVIELGREFANAGKLHPVAELWFCRALEGRAMIDRDTALFSEIDTRLTTLSVEDSWTREGRANVFRNLGDARRYGDNWQGAIDAYRASTALTPAEELRTFEAECELLLGRIDEAFRLIRSVSLDRLGEPERADHAFIYFYIALRRGDRQSLLDARDLLKQARTPQPYFETRRLRHIVTVGEALDALAAKEALPEIGPIMAGLKRLSRYVMLQPNWNGVGINGNALIDDFVALAEEKAKREADESPTYLGLSEEIDRA